MEQNQQKSVWLKLLLPICLGVFATAIYHNAIKTQKVRVGSLVASQNFTMGTEIEIENWGTAFKESELVFHASSAAKTKMLFDKKNIQAAITGSKIKFTRDVEKDQPLSVYDFESLN